MVLECRQVGFHQINGRLDAIGHIHHRQHRVLPDEAGVAFAPGRLVVDRHGVVGGASAGQSLGADDARVAQATHVQAKAFEVVVTEKFARHLGDTVHRRRTQDGLLWRVVPRRLRPENGDGTGTEQPHHLVLAGDFEDIVQAVHVHIPGQERLLLADGRQDGSQVIDGVNVVLPHHLLDGLPLGYVNELERARIPQRRVGPSPVAGGHNVFAAVSLAQGHGQLRTDLPYRSGDKDLLHFF